MADVRYDVLPHDAIKAMAGKEILQAIVDGRLPQAPISEPLSFWLAEVGEGTATFEGEPSDALRNPAGSVHGGWAFTMIDSACACAGHTLLPAGAGYSTIETKVNFAKPILASTGRVRCEARVAAQGRTIISAEAWVKDSSGRLLAHGTSTLMVLPARS